MLSLFRPLRAPNYGETTEQYAAALKRARDGTDDPQGVLASGAVGVSVMKSRSYGAREGRRAILRWHKGAVVDPMEEV
jgi:hypothetical protein